jgi:hypothetical protein
MEVADGELRETVDLINISNATYSKEINDLYAVMEEQKLILERLVLTPIERLVANSPVSFSKNRLSSVNLVKDTIGTMETMGNYSRLQRSQSTESSPASSPNSTPSSSPRGGAREKLRVTSKGKEDSGVIQHRAKVFKEKISPTTSNQEPLKIIETESAKPVSSLPNVTSSDKYKTTLDSDRKAMEGVANVKKHNISDYPPQLVGAVSVRAQISKLSPKGVSKTNPNLETTIPRSQVSTLSKAFQPSTGTYVPKPISNKDEKTTSPKPTSAITTTTKREP